MSLDTTLTDIISRLRQGRFQNEQADSQARAAIPEAWRELVEKGDELLVELLASAV